MSALAPNLQQRLRRYQFNPKVFLADRAIRKSPFFEGYAGALPAYRANARIAVNLDPKFIYFRVPKAANSTIVATLRSGETKGEVKSWDEADSLKRSFKRPSEVSGIATDLDGYIKFVFCRNPVERAVSAYLDKLCRPSSQLTLVRRLLKLDEGTDISFDHCLTFLEEHDGCGLDGHFARQSDICFLDQSQLDFIGRFENLEADLNEICQRIFDRPAEITNWRPHKTQKDLVLTGAQKARLERIYGSDFEKFGY